MKPLLFCLSIALTIGVFFAPTPDTSQAPAARVPILVELFTSEGCSSCPPADSFLEKLDRQPTPGTEFIVLSEHVDYWNHIGWKDPYSSHSYSERQDAYAQRFGLDSVYTPQMVVDGSTEFTGSDTAQAQKAFSNALTGRKISIHLSLIPGDPHTIHARIIANPLSPAIPAREADVYVAVALNHAESHVSAGENGGRTLTHVAVVRSLVKVGKLTHENGFDQNVPLKLVLGDAPRNLRVIVFVQETGQGRVLAAAEQPIVQ